MTSLQAMYRQPATLQATFAEATHNLDEVQGAIIAAANFNEKIAQLDTIQLRQAQLTECANTVNSNLIHSVQTTGICLSGMQTIARHCATILQNITDSFNAADQRSLDIEPVKITLQAFKTKILGFTQLFVPIVNESVDGRFKSMLYPKHLQPARQACDLVDQVLKNIEQTNTALATINETKQKFELKCNATCDNTSYMQQYLPQPSDEINGMAERIAHLNEVEATHAHLMQGFAQYFDTIINNTGDAKNHIMQAIDDHVHPDLNHHMAQTLNRMGLNGAMIMEYVFQQIILPYKIMTNLPQPTVPNINTISQYAEWFVNVHAPENLNDVNLVTLYKFIVELLNADPSSAELRATYGNQIVINCIEALHTLANTNELVPYTHVRQTIAAANEAVAFGINVAPIYQMLYEALKKYIVTTSKLALNDVNAATAVHTVLELVREQEFARDLFATARATMEAATYRWLCGWKTAKQLDRARKNKELAPRIAEIFALTEIFALADAINAEEEVDAEDDDSVEGEEPAE